MNIYMLSTKRQGQNKVEQTNKVFTVSEGHIMLLMVRGHHREPSCATVALE